MVLELSPHINGIYLSIQRITFNQWIFDKGARNSKIDKGKILTYDVGAIGQPHKKNMEENSLMS